MTQGILLDVDMGPQGMYVIGERGRPDLLPGQPPWCTKKYRGKEQEGKEKGGLCFQAKGIPSAGNHPSQTGKHSRHTVFHDAVP